MTTPARPLTEFDSEMTAAEVGEKFKRSERWVKDRIKRDAIEHTRHGGKITFTPAQYLAFQALDRVQPVAESVTTGPK